jgi:hypothetical protein
MIIAALDQPGQIDEARGMSDAPPTAAGYSTAVAGAPGEAVKSLRDSGGKTWLLG